MSWIVDHAFTLYVLCGIVAVGLLLIWRNNRQTKYLGFTAGVFVVIGLIGLATLFHISDSKQIENNVRAMRNAVVERKVDDLFKHVSKDFRFKAMDRDMMHAAVKAMMANHQITEIGITSFRVEEVSREKGLATASFLVTAFPDREMFRMEADFVLEGDQWKLKTLRFFMATGGPEIDVPGLR